MFVPSCPLLCLSCSIADGRGGFASLYGFCSWFPLVDEATSAACQQSDLIGRFTILQHPSIQAKGKDLPAPVPQLASTPILLEHSQDDAVIAIKNGTRMWDTLKKFGFLDVAWHDYGDEGHWINEPRGVDDFVAFFYAEL